MKQTIPHAVAALAAAFFIHTTNAQTLSLSTEHRAMQPLHTSQATTEHRADAEKDPAGFTVVSSNLYRAKTLFTGSARAIWVGDSWALMQHPDRLPYGSLMVWPIGHLSAANVGFRPGVIAVGSDQTAGTGRLERVYEGQQWRVEFDMLQGQQYFGLPLLNMTKVFGDSGLLLDHTWSGIDRIESMYANNNGIGKGDLPPFAQPGDSIRCRVLYYTPVDIANLLPSINLYDGMQNFRGTADLRNSARAYWHLGEDPDGGQTRTPVPSQINAIGFDPIISADNTSGPRIVMAQDPANPIIGSNTYWIFGGAVYYRALPDGSPEPGFYHSGLGGNSWSFAGLGDDIPSTGLKNFSDEQLLHWLDVTTLDRNQTPVVILHIATEPSDRPTMEAETLKIIQRFRNAFAAIGTVAPRFLLVGSYMHIITPKTPDQSRVFVEQLNSVYLGLAQSQPDCAFFSLYAATDGTFFTSDDVGGPGTQQAARDWLNANGWSTITYGGTTYNLASATNNGLDGNLVPGGLHLGPTPAAAFYAKLIGDAIAASKCPGDFNADDLVDTTDVTAFLNAWVIKDPAADFNNDGFINTADVLAFLNAWNQPC